MPYLVFWVIFNIIGWNGKGMEDFLFSSCLGKEKKDSNRKKIERM